MFFSIITALLYTLSFPFFSLWWLCFFALAPFFYALAEKCSLWKRAAFGFFLGSCLVLGTAHWLFFALTHEYEKTWTTAVSFIAVFAILPYALLFTCFALAFGYLKKHSLYFFALVVPGLWTLTEFLKQIIPVMIPWADLGYAALGGRYYAQIADMCGGAGVGFLLVTVNGVVAFLVLDLVRERNRGFKPWMAQNKSALALLVFVLAAPNIYGVIRLLPEQSPVHEEALEATLVQACFSQKERWSGLGFINRVKTYAGLSELPTAAAPALVIWPETVLNSSTRVGDKFFREMIWSIGPETLLVSGGLRKTPDNRGTFNSAFFISGQGRVIAYDKHILLPYSENAPAINVLGDYYTAPSQFEPGLSPLCVDTPLGKIGASICFEALYSSHVRKSVREGAQVLVNISNDSWFNSTMPYMHLDAARMRAIENRRWMLRASNSGFCAIIAPDGSLKGRSGLNARQMIRGGYALSDKLTPFTRLGNWVLILSSLVVLGGFLTRRKPVPAKDQATTQTADL